MTGTADESDQGSGRGGGLSRWLATVGFLLAVAGVPLLQLIVDVRAGGPTGDGVPQLAGLGAVLQAVPETYRQSEGTMTERLLLVNQELQAGLQDYESGLSEFTWLRRPARPLQQLLDAGFRRGSGQVLEARGGWLFLRSELQSLAAGGVRHFSGRRDPGAGGMAAELVRDPLPAIVQFQRLLQQRGVELLLVPIPAKAAVCPGGLLSALSSGQRVDVRLGEFLTELTAAGVQVVDLLPEFLRAADPESLYCRTDSHLSGTGIGRVAEILARELRLRGHCGLRAGVPLQVETREVQITGDLARMLDPETQRRERLQLEFVTDPVTGAAPPGAASFAAFPEPPLLLLGDSHVLVYDAADLHAVGAGLPQQLARSVDAGIETLGVRGSGGTGARRLALQQPDRLSSLRVVVWCFAAREFTELPEGWPLVEVPDFRDVR
ncbi:MAG: alginate O-acetyltransferase AlgX-related protein [Planctomycetaceae bacterium]